MKILFLVNDAPFLIEFLGKIAFEAEKKGDEVLVVFNSKISEYKKKSFFPKNVKFISRIDWCIENYKLDKKTENYNELSWRELFPIFDRYKVLDFSFEKSFLMLSSTFKFFEFIFNAEKPDVVISEPPADFFHLIAMIFCQKKNVPYLGFGSSRFENRIDVYDKESTYSEYEKTFNKINYNDLSLEEKKFTEDFFDKFISHKQLPSYMKYIKTGFNQTEILKHYIKRVGKSLSWISWYSKNRKSFKEFDYESETIFKNSLMSPFKMEKKQFKIFSQKNIFQKYEKDKNFFLFPLHFQSEASTSVYATYYCNQENTINNIAFALPFPYKLYIKEHPAAVGVKPKSFYQNLKKLPNVVLISEKENVENIIKDSSGVITLTSTVGLEAALVGKPVYVLGDAFYSYHPFCRIPQNFKELKKQIEKDLAKKPPDKKDLKEVNGRFIASYFRNTIEGSIAASSVGEDKNNYEKIYKSLKNIIKI